MNKPQSYNLDIGNINKIKELAKDKKWSASLWLDEHLTELFTLNRLVDAGAVLESQWTDEERKQAAKVKDTREFDLVWSMYDKKGNKKTSLSKFNKLSDSNKKLMSVHLPNYIKSTPDKQYRKNLETYINQECWNDEVMVNQKDSNEPRRFSKVTEQNIINTMGWADE